MSIKVHSPVSTLPVDIGASNPKQDSPVTPSSSEGANQSNSVRRGSMQGLASTSPEVGQFLAFNGLRDDIKKLASASPEEVPHKVAQLFEKAEGLSNKNQLSEKNQAELASALGEQHFIFASNKFPEDFKANVFNTILDKTAHLSGDNLAMVLKSLAPQTLWMPAKSKAAAFTRFADILEDSSKQLSDQHKFNILSSLRDAMDVSLEDEKPNARSSSAAA